MKKHILLVLILFTSLGIKCQNINPKYYVFAFTDNNNCRIGWNSSPSNLVLDISIHKDSIGKLKRIEEVTKFKFRKKAIKEDPNSNYRRFKIKYHNKADWRMEEFYSFSKLEYDTLTNIQWWLGEFKYESIMNKSKNDKESFLAGLFLAYGKIQSDTFCIKIKNDSIKFDVFRKLINEFHSYIIEEKVELKIRDNGGSLNDYFYMKFMPSAELKKILEYEIKRKKTLANSRS